MSIRLLSPTDAPAFQRLRLEGLKESPTAFASSYEEECDIPMAEVADRLEPQADRAVFGAFDGSALVGIVGLRQEGKRKLMHKAYIWGVYVTPAARKQGIGARLVDAALSHAALELKVRQVNLGVNAANAAAKALYERMGFVTFALERSFMLVDGVPQDELHMVAFLEGRFQS